MSYEVRDLFGCPPRHFKTKVRARGPHPTLVDVLERHPDWRARLVDVLTVNDPDRYREPQPAYVRVEQRRAARERDRERRRAARARAIAERSRRAGDLWAADRARRLAARRAGLKGQR